MFTFVYEDLLTLLKEQVCLFNLPMYMVGFLVMVMVLFSSSSSTVVQLCASSQPQSPVNQAVRGDVS